MPRLSENSVHEIARQIRYLPEITSTIKGVNGAPEEADIIAACRKIGRNVRGEYSVQRIADALCEY